MSDHQTAQVEHIEAACREKIQGWWHAADRPTRYPASDRDAVELMRALGYDCREATLNEFVRKGYVPAPAVDPRNGRRAWSAGHICALAIRLEQMRRWQPNHHAHAHKLWAAELREVLAQQTGNESGIDDWRQYTVESLVYALAETDDRAARQALVVAIKKHLPKTFGPTSADEVGPVDEGKG